MVMRLELTVHGGWMLDARGDHACCDRCAGGVAARIARRRLLKAAVFRPADATPGTGFATSGELPRAVTGTVIDVSPHLLVLSHGNGQERFALTPDAAAWRGAPIDPAAVRPGDEAVVRLHKRARGVADPIWANIGPATGPIPAPP